MEENCSCPAGGVQFLLSNKTSLTSISIFKWRQNLVTEVFLQQILSGAFEWQTEQHLCYLPSPPGGFSFRIWASVSSPLSGVWASLRFFKILLKKPPDLFNTEAQAKYSQTVFSNSADGCSCNHNRKKEICQSGLRRVILWQLDFDSAETSLENWICSCFFHKIPDSLQCKKKMIQLTWSEENVFWEKKYFFLALKVQHHTWTWGCLDYSFLMNSVTPADGWFTVYSYLISKPVFS